MTYFFTGNSDYLLREQIVSWKQKFLEKFGDFNFVDIKNIEEVNKNFLIENLTAQSFLDEKKLIIINLETTKKESSESITTFLLETIEKIPENNIVLLHLLNPDKRSKLYKGLKEKCKTKEFNTGDDINIQHTIQKKYPNQISVDAIQILTKYKGGNLQKIVSEIEKLLITKEHIETHDITENIASELEESIFQIIDDIMNKNTINAIKKIDTTLQDTNVYAFYNGLLANLRTSTFISKYKHFDVEPKDIGVRLNLGNRSFLTTKTYKIPYQKLQNLYIELIEIDKKMKTGKLIGSEDEVFQMEIEKCIIKAN